MSLLMTALNPVTTCSHLALKLVTLGLYLDLNEHQMTIRWWLGMDTSVHHSFHLVDMHHVLDPLRHCALACKDGW